MQESLECREEADLISDRKMHSFPSEARGKRTDMCMTILQI